MADRKFEHSLTTVEYASIGGVSLPTSARLEKLPTFDPADDSTWKPLLTNALRENFEAKGVELVRWEVEHRVYADDGKRFAALVWLKEKQVAADAKADRRHWQIVVISLAGVVVAIIIGLLTLK